MASFTRLVVPLTLVLSCGVVDSELSTGEFGTDESSTVVEDYELTTGERMRVRGHYVQGTSSGKPMFILGDTAWLLPQQKRESVITYLDARKAQGFNVVLASLSPGAPNAYGDMAFLKRGDGKPDVARAATTPGSSFSNSTEYDFWDHLRWNVQVAKDRGFTFLLMMGGGEFWDRSYSTKNAYVQTRAAAYQYGISVGTQMKDYRDAMIFSVVDDYDVRTATLDMRPLYRAFAEGLADGMNGVHQFDGKADWSTSMISAMPGSGSEGTYHEFPGESWVKFNINEAHNNVAARRTRAAFDSKPTKPAIVLESNFDNTSIPDWQMRNQAYIPVFSGAFGHVYAASGVWNFKTDWKSKLNFPVVAQLKHLAKLMNEWGDAGYMARVHDQSLLLAPGAHRGGDNPAFVGNGGDLQVATRSGGARAMVFAMNGRNIGVKMSQLNGPTMRASWYNPRNGKWHKNGTETASRSTSTAFVTVTAGKGAPDRTFDPPGTPSDGNDWVLVLESAGSSLPSEQTATIPDFCAKCRHCMTQGSFDEGFCNQFKSGRNFNEAQCTSSTNTTHLNNMNVSKAQLQAWTCSEFDSNE